jgi:hypothetical protein
MDGWMDGLFYVPLKNFSLIWRHHHLSVDPLYDARMTKLTSLPDQALSQSHQNVGHCIL